MKTIKQIEEANYLSTSDIADYFCHYRNWMKSGIGEAPTKLPEMVDYAVIALRKLETLEKKV